MPETPKPKHTDAIAVLTWRKQDTWGRRYALCMPDDSVLTTYRESGLTRNRLAVETPTGAWRVRIRGLFLDRYSVFNESGTEVAALRIRPLRFRRPGAIEPVGEAPIELSRPTWNNFRLLATSVRGDLYELRYRMNWQRLAPEFLLELLPGSQGEPKTLLYAALGFALLMRSFRSAGK
ncbi:MAG: hypothetical protein SFY70_03845 [Bacteroidia bacterium]|nr:hypothetical protein [Bacteroidia bacterium]